MRCLHSGDVGRFMAPLIDEDPSARGKRSHQAKDALVSDQFPQDAVFAVHEELLSMPGILVIVYFSEAALLLRYRRPLLSSCCL